MREGLHKYPRLYVPGPLAAGELHLNADHAHYLRHVMRREDGQDVRLFNGSDGEWLGTLSFPGKRDAHVMLNEQVKPQTRRARRVHLFFAPLKKDRLETLIECAVQLDATDLHPVITERTEVREIKHDKLNAYIVEAAEQCERLDLPVLHPLEPMERIAMPVFAGLERSDARPLRDAIVPPGDVACLVGPVGGWSDGERAFLNESPNVTPVTLGPNVLRSETAVAAMLTRLGSP